MNKNYWDKVYSNDEPWNNKFPSNFLLELENKFKDENKKIIDIACGIGRNSFPFAKHGAEIDFIDISNKALSIIKETEKKYDAQFNYHNLDISKHVYKKDYYDLAIFYGAINSVPKKEWKNLAIKISDSLKEGAYLAVSVFTKQKIAFEYDEGMIDYAEPAELVKLFKELNIEKCDSRILTHNHYPNGMHTHSLERYLFKKTTIIKRSDSTIKIAPIGPTNPNYSSISLKKNSEIFYHSAEKLGRFMSKNDCEFIGVPDKGLVKTTFDSYLKSCKSGTATLLVPDLDDEISYGDTSWVKRIKLNHPNTNIKLINNISWSAQVVQISELADILVVLGHSSGSMIEIGWTKWTRKPVFASRDLASALPNEITDTIQYFDNATFDDLLFSLEKHIQRIRSNN